MHSSAKAEALTPSVCSTPFGDIDECTQSARTDAPANRGAQRLSATLMNARSSSGYGWAPSSGAQRLSATLMNALEPNTVLVASTAWACSTPFGDIDECTSSSPSVHAVPSSCSTPFGDIDECTGPSGPPLFPSGGSAQRLSATLMNAPTKVELEVDPGQLCSTPFGDIDECTLFNPPSQEVSEVLNAFRRH